MGQGEGKEVKDLDAKWLWLGEECVYEKGKNLHRFSSFFSRNG